MTPEGFERIAQILANVATQKALNELSIALLTITIDRYVTSANTRMEQMERNLDNLIRIITAEHSNGKRGKK